MLVLGAVIAVILVTRLGLWSWNAPVPEHPHIVMISIDTLRADHLGCYGSPDVQTPRIDAFADESVLFERHYVAAPTTLVSHASLMTGLWPHTHGVPRNGYVLHEDNVTLAETLKAAGYDTAAFIGAYPLAQNTAFDQGFDHFDDDLGVYTGGKPRARRDGDKINEALFDWLDDRRRTKRPMFLFVHYYDVHAPYYPPKPYRSMYGKVTLNGAGRRSHIKRIRHWYQVKPPEVVQPHADALRSLYKGGVTYTDHLVGVMLDDLRDRGILDRAVVVLTSDHGESFDEHDEYWNHGYTTYEEAVHAPLIVRLPGGTGGGRRVPHLMSNVDVLPTLLDQLELDGPRGEGLSFSPLLDGEAQPPRSTVFSEATKPYFAVGETWHNELHQAAVRTPDAKLIHEPLSHERELYDLRADPAEATNLHDDPSYSELRDTLRGHLLGWRDQADPLPSHSLSPEQTHLLKSLGYVDDG